MCRGNSLHITSHLKTFMQKCWGIEPDISGSQQLAMVAKQNPHVYTLRLHISVYWISILDKQEDCYL